MIQDTLICIIDDDEAVRVATESLVRSLGFSARAFASAEDFLQSPSLRTASCVITDVNMAGMSGVELQSCLRTHGLSLPMIFITAFPEERTRKCVDAAGAIGFLSKPFDGRAMIECIEKALGREPGGLPH